MVPQWGEQTNSAETHAYAHKPWKSSRSKKEVRDSQMEDFKLWLGRVEARNVAVAV